MIVIPQRFGGLTIPIVRASAPPTHQFITSAVSASDSSGYTFTSQSIGTAAANRFVVVGVHGEGNSATPTVTIGGNSMNLIHSATDPGSANAALFGLIVASGTTASVVVNWSSGQSNCGIGIWAVYGLSSQTPVSTSEDTGSQSMNLSLNTVKDGIVIGVVAHRDKGSPASTIAWTGLTERYDEQVEGARGHSGASLQVDTQETPRTITAVMSSSPRWCAGIAAVLR